MRQLLFLASILLSLPAFALANKQITITISPDYPLNVVNTQLICSSIHASMPTDALNKLETLSGLPFTCKISTDDSGKKQLMIILTLANPS